MGGLRGVLVTASRWVVQRRQVGRTRRTTDPRQVWVGRPVPGAEACEGSVQVHPAGAGFDANSGHATERDDGERDSDVACVGVCPRRPRPSRRNCIGR